MKGGYKTQRRDQFASICCALEKLVIWKKYSEKGKRNGNYQKTIA